MTSAVLFRATAEADLDSIYEHVATDSSDRAIGYIRRIRQRCEGLAEFPQSGRSRSEFGTGLRSVAFERRVLIVYAVREEAVEIVRILYGGRDVEALLGDEDPSP